MEGLGVGADVFVAERLGELLGGGGDDGVVAGAAHLKSLCVSRGFFSRVQWTGGPGVRGVSESFACDGGIIF